MIPVPRSCCCWLVTLFHALMTCTGRHTESRTARWTSPLSSSATSQPSADVTAAKVVPAQSRGPWTCRVSAPDVPPRDALALTLFCGIWPPSCSTVLHEPQLGDQSSGSLLSARCRLRSIPCSITGPCAGPISISGIGTDCSAGSSAAALTQSLLALNSTMTALNLSSLTATYYCIPTVPSLAFMPGLGVLGAQLLPPLPASMLYNWGVRL